MSSKVSEAFAYVWDGGTLGNSTAKAEHAATQIATTNKMPAIFINLRILDINLVPHLSYEE